MGNFQPHSSFLSVVSLRGVLVGHCYGCVLLVTNLTLYTTTLLMARIFIEAARQMSKVNREVEVRLVENLLGMWMMELIPLAILIQKCCQMYLLESITYLKNG